jgi:hypothetical protein
VEERDGARNIIQRRFELAAKPPDSTKEPEAIPPDVVPSTAPPPPISREPSDLELRARQMRWVKERLQFEARAEPSDAPKGSK